MKTIVGVRSAPHRLIDDDGTSRPYRWHISTADRVAIEAALRTADTVVAVGVGGKPAGEAVRAALTMGTDRGVHVRFDPIEEIIGEKFAHVLARVTAREDADALFVGESSPLMGAEIPGLAAETLRWPSTSRVTAIGDQVAETDPGRFSDTEIAVQRRLGVGQQELLGIEPPIVLGIDSGFANPRRASLETAVAGRKREIEVSTLENVAPDESRFSMSVGRATIENVTPNEQWGRGNPPRGGTVERIYQMLGRDAGGDGQTGGDVIDAPPDEAAERVVEYLQDNDLL